MPLLDELGPGLCRIARAAIARYLEGERTALDMPASELRHAVFVTLRTETGELRGCVGSLAPVESDLYAETARAAVLAASRDPRFMPISERELTGLRIEVSVLMAEERIESLAELDPQKYAVVVRDTAGRRGVLLPGIPGIEDAAAQVRIARSKAGIAPGSPVTLGRLAVRKFAEAVGAAGIEPATSSV